jgi:hypothetical protein
MSRRNLTFFGTTQGVPLEAFDDFALTRGLDDLRRGRGENRGQVTFTKRRVQVGRGTFATEDKVDIDLYAIRVGVDDDDYRRFGSRELRKFENALADFYTEIIEPIQYNTIAIDIDHLPWVRDTKETNDYLKTVDSSGQIVEITPTYNYYAGSYEEMLPMLDERILPSLYETEICRILSERDNDFYVGSDRSLASARSRCNDLLPQTPDDWNDFGTLLGENQNFNPDSTNITVFPQTEIKQILNLHDKKNLYPMYVDITFPTAPTGPFMKAVEQAKLSTTLFDTIIGIQTGVGPATYPIKGSTSTVVRLDEETVESQPASFTGQVEVLSIGPAIETMLNQARAGQNEQAANAEFLTLRGNERNPGQETGSCLSLLDRVYMKAITDRIDTILSRATAPGLINRLNSRTSIHPAKIGLPNDLAEDTGQEIIAYSVEKRYAGRAAVLSTHIFPNSDDLGVLKYVDTQVKNEIDYEYDVYAHILTTSERGTLEFESNFAPNRYAIKTTVADKELVLVKVPVASKKNFVDEELLARGRFVTPNGISFPEIRIIDRPPVPPNFTFIPYKGVKNKLLIKLERQTDELTGQRTVPFIPIMNGDADRFNLLRDHQLIENFDLPEGHVEFKSEGEDTTLVQVFRTTEEPRYDIDPEDGSVINIKKSAYANFSDNLYREVTADAGLAFTDTLTPNTKYYYTFRSVDLSGNFSNPSAIMQVEIVETEGVTYPLIKEYIPNRTEPNKQDSRTMARFLQIRPSYLMSEPLPDPDGNLAVGQRIDDTTFGKHYKIRITSLDTGRQFDLNCTFEKKTQEES